MTVPTDQRLATHGQASGLAAMALAAMGFSWGFIIVKGVALPAATVGFWRLLIGAGALALVARALRAPWPVRWGPVIGAGICFGLHQLVFIAASQQTSIAIVTLIAALQPLAVSMVSHRVLGERVPPGLRGAAGLGVVGVAVVVLANLEAPSRTLRGDLLAALNLVLFTAFFLFSKRARAEGTPTLTQTTCTLGIAWLVVLPALAFNEPRIPSAGWQWVLLAVLALVPGNGHLLVNWAHPRVSATLASLILATIPLLSSTWAHFVFGEPLGAWHALGMALAAAAIESGRRAERRA